jgi:hypothetical protein
VGQSPGPASVAVGGGPANKRCVPPGGDAVADLFGQQGLRPGPHTCQAQAERCGRDMQLVPCQFFEVTSP